MANIPETLCEIDAIDCEVLTCAQVAKVLKADPYSLHKQATTSPEQLGFPVIVCGNRVKIPKQPFVKFMKGEKC